MTQKDKRSNRRRVSCGFHHKRHQACPDNCEGRISHPPEVHTPFQDKFTVGCTECKTYFQEKLFSQTTLSGKPISQVIATPSSSPSSPPTSPVTFTTSSTTTTATTTSNKKKKTIPLNCKKVEQSVEFNINNKVIIKPSQVVDTSAIVPSVSASSINSLSGSTGLSNLQATSENNIVSYTSSTSTSDDTTSEANSKKRKYSFDEADSQIEYSSFSSSPCSSSPLLSRVPSPSQEVVNSSPIASPQLTVPSTPLLPLTSNTNNSNTNSSNNTNSMLVAESLLFLLEQEVEKEIITQKENDLSVRKVKQIQEQEYVDRIQQVLEYKKGQQDLEYIRLQQKQKELESWSIHLANCEKELIFKQQQLNNFNFNLQQQNQHNQHQQQRNNNNNNNNKVQQLPQLPQLQSLQQHNNSNNNKQNSMSFFNLLNSLAEESTLSL